VALSGHGGKEGTSLSLYRGQKKGEKKEEPPLTGLRRKGEKINGPPPMAGVAREKALLI